MKKKHLLYILSLTLFIFASCDADDKINYTPEVLFDFAAGTNLVKAEKGAAQYVVTGTVTSANGITAFSISTANARTGDVIAEIDNTKKVFETPQDKYDFSYTISDLDENKAIKLKVMDTAGDEFQQNFVVEITPAVVFSENSKQLESLDKYYGVFYAEWLEGRIYKSRDAGKYAVEVNVGMENKGGHAMLISPAKHSLTFAGARTTKFGATEMTTEQFNSISRVDDTMLKALSPDSESIQIEKGKVYSYQTQDGQKGAIYIQNLTGDPGNEKDQTVTATIVTKLQAK